METNCPSPEPIKISLLDIFPSFIELNPKQEEMLLIFQGLNNFYNLKEMLTLHNKIEIENNEQSSILISLIKSSTIIASGFITIKQGEQWITLNYENKNKKNSSNLAFNLMDCIKLKIYCELKNKSQINTTFNNININNSSLNINTNINYSNRNNNNNKGKNVINQINLKISKKNINNKILLKGSPSKGFREKNINRRSPNKDLYDFNNNLKIPNNEDILNNNLLKSSNFNTFNYMNVNINMNPYTTISKCSIKKIDLNSSSKTRNSKIAKKKSINGKFSSIRTSNNNINGIKKMNTSTCSLNTINPNKNKKSRLTPDIEIKEIKNSKIGGSPGPNFKYKNKLDDDLTDKIQTLGQTNDKTFLYAPKTKNFHVKDLYKNNYSIEEKDQSIQAKKKNKKNYSNNIVNNNIENINMNIIINKANNSNSNNANKYRTINEGNQNNGFNNTFNNINKQGIKSKLLYTSKTNKYNNNSINNRPIKTNVTTTNTTKKNNEMDINSFDDEEKNKSKENNKINPKDKVGIYTTKRIDNKKNNVKNINKKTDRESKNTSSQKNIINEDIVLIKTNENKDKNEMIKLEEEKNELENKEKNELENKEKNNTEKIEPNNIINNEEENEIEIENDNFTRMKEDFILLYNDDYVNNVQDDLLNLEIELLIEKIAELISCYHLQLEEKRMINLLFQNDYNSNASKFKQINKLMKKLEISKIDYEIKNFNKKENKSSLKKEDRINLLVNKTEIELFENIFPKKEENKEIKNKLRGIMLSILKKEENRNILSNDEKFNKWINLYNIQNKNEINENKEKNNKSNPQKKVNKENSFNNKTTKTNNSTISLDNTYRKKMPNSPTYQKGNKKIPSSELAHQKNNKEF